MAKITPAAYAVLSRIKVYGLDSWLPGRIVVSRLVDTTFTRVNARIISDLLRGGYVVADTSGVMTPTLSGEVELWSKPVQLVRESRQRISGLWLQVVTSDWGVEADATRLRGMVLSGLGFLAGKNPARLALIHQRTRHGVGNECLVAIVLSATSLVTAHYGDAFATHAHRVGVRAY